jgi:hypothetical protein
VSQQRWDGGSLRKGAELRCRERAGDQAMPKHASLKERAKDKRRGFKRRHVACKAAARPADKVWCFSPLRFCNRRRSGGGAANLLHLVGVASSRPPATV